MTCISALTEMEVYYFLLGKEGVEQSEIKFALEHLKIYLLEAIFLFPSTFIINYLLLIMKF